MLVGFVSGITVSEEISGKFNNKDSRVRIIIRAPIPVGDNSKMMSIASDSVLNGKIKNDLGDRLSIDVSLEELEELVSQGFEVIGEDMEVRAFLQDAIGVVKADKAWNLDFLNISLNGSQVSVCVIDTGVLSTHPALAGKVLGQHCFCSDREGINSNCCSDGTNENNESVDNAGHGTHVSGIIAATGEIYGVAKGANIVAVKVLNSSGVGYASDIKKAIEWCSNDDQINAYNISVISLSLGGGQYTSSATCDDSSNVQSAINTAILKNISVVVATGNTAGGLTNPVAGISYPACLYNTTKVTASVEAGNAYASFAFRHANFPDILVTPGVSVNSTAINGDTECEVINGYCEKSGTSMATPIVSGAIALIKQYSRLSGKIKTSDEIKQALNDTGNVLEDVLSGYSFSRIDVYSALLSLDIDVPNVTLVSPVNDHINLSANQTFICNATDWQLKNITFNLWNSSGFLIFNKTKNISGIQNETTFNYTNMTEDIYEWNCEAYDIEDNLGVSSSNFSLTVGGLEVSLDSPLNGSYTNTNETNFTCTSKSDLSYELSNITFRLWNSSGDLINISTRNISGIQNETTFNYTFIDQGNYSWECSAVNNNSNETNGINYTITYDIIYPNVTVSPVSTTTSSATITWTTNEETNASIVSNSNIANASFSKTHSETISGLSASTSYNYNITYCDRAGNCNSTEGSFTTSDEVAVRRSGGGGGSSVLRTNNYIASIAEVSSGYIQTLKSEDKINFSISRLETTKHSLTVNEVGIDYANITIESDPITLVLNIGEAAKLSLESEKYYDLLVTLNNITNNISSITLQLISEKITPIPIHTFEKNETAENENAPKSYNFVNYVCVGFLLVIVFILIVSLIKGIHYEIKEPKKLKGSKPKKKNGKGKKTKA